MSTAAARMRVLRQRQKAGRIVLEIEIDEIEAAESLVIAGVLNAKADGDYSRAELAHAVERLLDMLQRDAYSLLSTRCSRATWRRRRC